ncbi:MAG: CAP domain-containing protein [Legionella sp.]|nr:MAG: CAP domain-containing protein [Legionella sp.]
MFKTTTKIILLISTLIGLIQPAQAASDTEIQNAILMHINQYRQQHGLGKLTMNAAMVKEARQHSADMASHRMGFGHKYFNQRINRLHKKIKNSGAGAENVAYNYKDAQDVVKNWLRSPGHKRNIDGNYNLTGIGVVHDSHGKLYFTQIFLRTGASQKYAVRSSAPGFFYKTFSR